MTKLTLHWPKGSFEAKCEQYDRAIRRPSLKRTPRGPWVKPLNVRRG